MSWCNGVIQDRIVIPIYNPKHDCRHAFVSPNFALIQTTSSGFPFRPSDHITILAFAIFVPISPVDFWSWHFRVPDLIYRKASPISRSRKISVSGRISMPIDSFRYHAHKGGVLFNEH